MFAILREECGMSRVISTDVVLGRMLDVVHLVDQCWDRIDDIAGELMITKRVVTFGVSAVEAGGAT